MTLDTVRRLGSLAYQVAKATKRLRSVQTRTLALLADADLPASDPTLTAEVLAALEQGLAHAAGAATAATLCITVMRDQLAAARQASDIELDDKENMNQ